MIIKVVPIYYEAFISVIELGKTKHTQAKQRHQPQP
jgi:hypothetical protein